MSSEMNLSDKMIERLKSLAAQEAWDDDSEFMVDDYCAGNMDDAFDGGVSSGKIKLARIILDDLGIEYPRGQNE